MILALETSTPVCSVVFENAAGNRFEERTDSAGSHSEKLFLFIKELMDQHHFSVKDLSAVLVSEGPGSYTGLRIAASGVKGLLFGSNIPLYSISTLASFAMSAHGREPSASTIHTILDARRVHLYHQKFNISGDMLKAAGDIDIIPIQSFEKTIKRGDVIIGTGLERLSEDSRAKARCFGKDFISAQSLIDLYHRQASGEFIQKADPADFDPNYFTSRQG